MRVKPAIEETNKRYFKRLVGRLRFVDARIPNEDYKLSKKKQAVLDAFIGPHKPKTKYFHVPFEIQNQVTDDELKNLQAIAESGGAIDLFRRVIIDNDTSSLSRSQITIIRHIHQKAQEQHNQPDFGIKDNYTLQLHLDYRMLPSVKQSGKNKGKPDRKSEALMLHAGVTYLRKDDTNKLYQRFLDIAARTPHSPRIRIPVVLTKSIAKRMEGTNAEWASLIVELTSNKSSETTVGVRLVCGKPPESPLINPKTVTRVLGRDFGYANTIAMTIVESATPVDVTQDSTAWIRVKTKESARKFFETHQCPEDVKIIHQAIFNGQCFLSKIDKYCTKIDRYKSRIDKGYNDLEKLKTEIKSALRLDESSLILPAHKQSSVANKVRQFFRLLGLIDDLKKARRTLYRKIAALKKNWFGFLSNVEMELAKHHGAVVARENLDVEAIEKDAPNYRGVTFNKMLNNGSKGQYQRRASATLKWNRIPEIVVGSWYTSRACTTHRVIVDKKDRKGEDIHLRCCGKNDHADTHASETIAKIVFLRKLSVPECDKHAKG